MGKAVNVHIPLSYKLMMGNHVVLLWSQTELPVLTAIPPEYSGVVDLAAAAEFCCTVMTFSMFSVPPVCHHYNFK